jgi:hypothetical protein
MNRRLQDEDNLLVMFRPDIAERRFLLTSGMRSQPRPVDTANSSALLRKETLA